MFGPLSPASPLWRPQGSIWGYQPMAHSRSTSLATITATALAAAQAGRASDFRTSATWAFYHPDMPAEGDFREAVARASNSVEPAPAAKAIVSAVAASNTFTAHARGGILRSAF